MLKDDSIFNLYIRVHKELIKNIKKLAEPYDFNHGELPVLVKLIKTGDGVSQKKIRKNLPISKSTLSKTVDNLVRKGFLWKKTDSEDNRSTLIYLTDKGKEMESITEEIKENVSSILLQGFEYDEKERLRNYLSRLLKNLQE